MDVPCTHVSGMEAARMRKKNKKLLRRKIVLHLPDLVNSKNLVLSSRGISQPYSPRILAGWLKILKHSGKPQSAIAQLSCRGKS